MAAGLHRTDSSRPYHWVNRRTCEHYLVWIPKAWRTAYDQNLFFYRQHESFLPNWCHITESSLIIGGKNSCTSHTGMATPMRSGSWISSLLLRPSQNAIPRVFQNMDVINPTGIRNKSRGLFPAPSRCPRIFSPQRYWYDWKFDAFFFFNVRGSQAHNNCSLLPALHNPYILLDYTST